MSSILTGSTMKKSTNPKLRKHLLDLLGPEHAQNKHTRSVESPHNSSTIISDAKPWWFDALPNGLRHKVIGPSGERHDPQRPMRDSVAPRRGYRDDDLLNDVLGRCRIAWPSGCYEWQQAANAKGYGRFKIGQRLYSPHRVAAYAAGIVDSLSDPQRLQCVLHECDNPRCCRPEHMKAGTMSQNMRDCVSRGRHPSTRKPGFPPGS